MGDAINLADPDFEPTDEQLMELSKRAFADVKERHQAALARLRVNIAARGAEVLREHEELEAASRKDT